MATQISGVVFATLRQLAPPFVDGNGNLYFVGLLSTDNSKLAMFKSSNGGSSWSEVDSGNRPDESEQIWCIDAFQDDDVIHIATQTATNGYLRYSTFQTSDNSSADVWGTKLQAVTTCDIYDAETTGCSIVVRSNGHIIILYNGDTSSGNSAVYYAKYTSSWSVDNNVFVSSTYDYFVNGACLGEDDKIYFMGGRANGSDYGVSKSLNSSDVLGTLRYGGSNYWAACCFGGCKPVYYDDDGVERITALWFDNNDNYAKLYEIDDDAAPGNVVTVGYTSDYAVSLPFARTINIAMAVDAETKTVHVIFPWQQGDLYHRSRIDADANMTNFVEINDAVTVEDYGGVVANVYQNGNNVVLAYVFNDNDSYYYDELLLRTLPLDASTSDGVSVSENVEMKPLLGIAVKDYYYRRRRIS